MRPHEQSLIFLLPAALHYCVLAIGHNMVICGIFIDRSHHKGTYIWDREILMMVSCVMCTCEKHVVDADQNKKVGSVLEKAT